MDYFITQLETGIPVIFQQAGVSLHFSVNVQEASSVKLFGHWI
jgi:hypothetical protein